MEVLKKNFGPVISCKISYSFDWRGPKEEPSENLKGDKIERYNAWKSSELKIRHNGYGYVCFATPEGAKKALAQKSLGGLQFEAFDLNKKKEKALNAKKNIYIHGFPAIYKEAELTNLFVKEGGVKVTSVFIAKDEKGNSLKHGVITFESVEDANKAKEKLQGKAIEGESLYLNELMSKDQRK